MKKVYIDKNSYFNGEISLRLENFNPLDFASYTNVLEELNEYMNKELNGRNPLSGVATDTEQLYISREKKHDKKPNSKATPKHSGMLDNGVYIKKVIYNRPATIIIWSDGTKTSSKCQEGDIYNPELGILLAYMKKIEGSDKILKLLEEWAPIKGKIDTTLNDIRKKSRSKTK